MDYGGGPLLTKLIYSKPCISLFLLVRHKIYNAQIWFMIDCTASYHFSDIP